MAYELELPLWSRSNLISDINEIHQRNPVFVELSISLECDWHPNDDEKEAVLNLIEDYDCRKKKIKLSSRSKTDEIDPWVTEILIMASKSWKGLELKGSFSDESFQFIIELIIANGGMQELELYELGLSDDSWKIFNSHKLGTGDANSKITIRSGDFNIDNRYCMSDATLAQIVQCLSGFQVLDITYMLSSYPATFRTLGQVLSSPDCELSKLRFDMLFDEGTVRGDFVNLMFEALATNSSLVHLNCECCWGGKYTEIELRSIWENLNKFQQLNSFTIDPGTTTMELMLEAFTTNTSLTNVSISHGDAFSHQRALTKAELTSLGKNLPKFTRLKTLMTTIPNDLTSLDFLCPLLDISSGLNQSLETLGFCNADYDLSFRGYYALSNGDNALLLQLAQRYPKLSNIGHIWPTTPALEHNLHMNGRWRKFMTIDPGLPLFLWRFVLADVENKHTSQSGQKHEDRIASVRYEIIKHLVLSHMGSFITATGGSSTSVVSMNMDDLGFKRKKPSHLEDAIKKKRITQSDSTK